MAGGASHGGGASVLLPDPPAPHGLLDGPALDAAMTSYKRMCPAQNLQMVSMHPATREQKSLVRDLGRRAGTSECLQLQESLQTKVFFGSTRDFERQIMWQFKCHKRYPLALAGVLINTRPIKDTDQVQLINTLCHTLYASN
jgi:hypothetical protein